MALRWEVFILGTRNPLSDALRSNTALGSGVEVPIPILSCAKPAIENIPENRITKSNTFLIFLMSEGESIVEFVNWLDEPPYIIDETKVTTNETEFKMANAVFRPTTGFCSQLNSKTKDISQ